MSRMYYRGHRAIRRRRMASRAMTDSVLESELMRFVEESIDCSSRERFRELVLRRLPDVVPSSGAMIASLDHGPGLPLSTGWRPEQLALMARSRKRIFAELRVISAQARPRGGVITDGEITDPGAFARTTLSE